MPVRYVKIAGGMAKELTHALVTALKANGVDVRRFGAIGADGAGECGVMSAQKLAVDPDVASAYRNVCLELAKDVGVTLLCQHCCGHRIQLASVDAFRTVGCLKELKRRIRSLYKQLGK